MKKFFYKVIDENGNTIFNHRSDSAERLLALLAKESRDSEGNTYCSFFFGKHETNIPENFCC